MNQIPQNASFFEINSKNTRYVFAAYDEQDRTRWLDTINPHLVNN